MPIAPNLLLYDKDNGQPGIYAPTAPGWSVAGITAVANQARVARFVPSRRMVVALVGFAVSTAAGANDNVDVGIYTGAGARLASSGPTAGKLNSTGAKTVAIAPTVVEAGGVYYAAVSFGAVGGAAAVVSGATFGSLGATQLMGSSMGRIEGDLMASAHPLPAALVLTASSTGTGALLALRES